jgi:streptogramin lyase
MDACGLEPFLEGGNIGSVTTAGAITETALPLGARNAPGGVVQGPDGALWFTATPNTIGRFPTDGLWFDECQGNKIGRLQ